MAQWYSDGLTISRSRVPPPAGAARELSSPELTFCVDIYFGIHINPVLQQWHVEDLGHSAKRAGDSLQVNTHTRIFDPRSGSGLTGLSRHSFNVSPA